MKFTMYKCKHCGQPHFDGYPESLCEEARNGALKIREESLLRDAIAQNEEAHSLLMQARTLSKIEGRAEKLNEAIGANREAWESLHKLIHEIEKEL